MIATRHWNPLFELNSFRREMNRLFENFPSGTSLRTGNYPPVNVWHSTDGVAFTAQLPGYKSDEIEITTTRNTLTLRGKRERAELVEGHRRQRDERFHGDFVRTFELPFDVTDDRVSASFQKGVLLISIGRPEQEKPRRIEIQIA